MSEAVTEGVFPVYAEGTGVLGEWLALTPPGLEPRLAGGQCRLLTASMQPLRALYGARWQGLESNPPSTGKTLGAREGRRCELVTKLDRAPEPRPPGAPPTTSWLSPSLRKFPEQTKSMQGSSSGTEQTLV